MISDLWLDLRYGIRILRKNPGFTAVAVLSLALGIGANTALFQLLDAVRLRTLPVSNPQEIAAIRIADMTGARGSFSSPHPTVTNPIWEQIRDLPNEPFSGVFAWGHDSFNLAVSGETRYAQGLWVSGSFFNVLGIRPLLGRVFEPGDDRRGCGSPGAVISYSFWQREFGGDASVIGRTITLDYNSVEIIGVTRRSFFGLEVGRSYDVALPICAEAAIRAANNRLDAGTSWWLIAMGRLKADRSAAEATTYLGSISPSIFQTTRPANYPPESVDRYLGFKLSAIPAGTGLSWLRDRYENPLWLLLSIAGIVLLIACANIANLTVARATGREREIAVRLALGGRRGRIVRQLLTESLLLASLGAALGVFLAGELSQALLSFFGTEAESVFLDLNLDWRVLGFTAGVTILTCALFGLTPALRTTGIVPGAVLKASGRGLTASRQRFGLRNALVISQVALSLVLLAGALLFSRSLGNLNALDSGFQQDGVVIANVDLTRLELPVERRQPFKRELLDRIRAIPGVDAASDTNVVPLSGNAWGNAIWIDGTDSKQRTNSLLSRISPDYFKTLVIPLLAGRDFDDRDTPVSPKVAVVNEAFARTVLDGENPVGRRFWIEATPRDPETLYEVVGLVKDTKYTDLRDDFSPIVYLPASQDPRPSRFDQMLIRSSAAVPVVLASVKREIGAVDPAILIHFQVFKTEIEGSLLRERLMATLSAFFGLLAVALSCVGLYGMMSYNVAGRTNEIGIRMALGAERKHVIWMILRNALVLVLMGVAIGIPVILAASSLVSSLLFGLSPTDPISLCAAVVALLAVAGLAGYLPAWRASRVDPVMALRDE